ncbi:MAG: rhomboid family intramembrane serine protease [Thermoprotei archaeon]|nr:MAG: rhomboid family intramembrane serine protease [Thermoprotei archaeon]
MIPLGVEGVRKKPYVTWMLVITNTAVFFLLFLSEALPSAIALYGLTPLKLIKGKGLYTLITSLFLHADILHLASNMIYLYVFGGAVEARLGSKYFLLFYLLCGIDASLIHTCIELVVGHPLNIPCIGASGAISGVLGAYLVLFPGSFVNIMTLTLLGLPLIIPVPAFLFLAIWFIYQLWMGMISLSLPYFIGVAFWAHIGGFLSGMIAALPLRRKRYVVRYGKVWYEVPVRFNTGSLAVKVWRSGFGEASM